MPSSHHDDLIPASRTEALLVLVTRWLRRTGAWGAAGGIATGFFVVFWIAASIFPTTASNFDVTTWNGNTRMAGLHMLLVQPISVVNLLLVVAILLWIALLRIDWSDRLLFTAAMILTAWAVSYTAYEVFEVLHAPRLSTLFAPVTLGFPFIDTVVGCVAYACFILMVQHSRMQLAWRLALTVLFLLAILSACMVPAIKEPITIAINIAGSVFLAATLLCFGFGLAKAAGINVFARQRMTATK